MFIRPITIEDFKIVLEWAQNPEFDEYFRRSPPLCDWAEPTKFMSLMGDKYLVIKNGKSIGLLNMSVEDHLSRIAKWGLLLAERESGDTEKIHAIIENTFFNKLGCNKLFCVTLAHREGLKHRLLTYGYKHEGTLRKSCLYRGELVNECIYGLIKGEQNGRGI